MNWKNKSLEAINEKSLQDYTQEIWDMLVELCYKDDCTPVTFEDDAIHGKLWTTFDLWFGYLANMMNGRCALAASIEFDLHKEVMSKYEEILAIYQKIKAQD